MSQYQDHLDIAKQCALDAGKIIKEAWERKTEVHFKAATDIVTETDKQSENLITSAIRKRFPEHLFVAEEDISEGRSKEELTDKPTWIIDPLDGTINFVSRIPFIAVSIAFAVQKQVVVGVIYNPILNEMFTAIRGQGAYLNDRKITVSETKTLKNAVVTTGCGAEIPENYITEFNNRMVAIIKNCRTWRRSGSAAMDMANVAMGRIDAYFERGIHAWDIAAGLVIVEEAGGCVSNFDQTPFDVCNRQVVAVNGILHKDFHANVLNFK